MICGICGYKICGIGIISSPYNYTVHLDCKDKVGSKLSLEWRKIRIREVK